MWSTKIFGFEFFYLFYHFFLYSFFGWIYESCLISFREKRLVNRGFLNGPVIPIYGAGATVIMMTLDPIRNHYIAVFFGGMLAASVLEFVTSWVMEKLFHAKWWDYSDWKFNLQGRICLAASLFWGVLSVSMEIIFKPGMDRLIAGIPRKAGEYAGYVIAVLFLGDLITTVISTVQLDKKLAELQKLRGELVSYLENSRLADITEEFRTEWKERVKGQKYTEALAGIRNRLEELKPEKDALPEFGKWKNELEERLKNFSFHYQKKLEKNNIIQNRLLQAFPNLKAAGKEEALKDWREKLHRKSGEQEGKEG